MERTTRLRHVSPDRTACATHLLLGFASAVALSLLHVAAAQAAPGACPLPDELDEKDKVECVKRARILVPQPRLSLEQVAKGPDFDPSDPRGSRHRYFEQSDDVLCYFRPHYAFKRIPGRSLKFQCWRLADDRRFQGRDGGAMSIEGPRIEIRKASNGENRARLVDASGDRQRPDRVKVKYLRPAHPDHDTRYHEVFTEVAVSRLFWALGIPADLMYAVQRVRCVGCDENPFRRGLFFGGGQKENTAAPTDAPRSFEMVTIERKHPFDEIEADTEYWRWLDAKSFYNSGIWNNEQRAGYDAYRLALGMVFYHNDKEQQNRVACARESENGQDVCLEPYIFVQDVGSTFGRKKRFFLSANPRGEYRHWKDMTVFSDPSRCELRAPLAGPARVSKEGQALLVKRLEALDRAKVEAVFRAARFDRMDQRQLERLRDEGAADAGEAAIREWTDTFMQRIEEVKGARGCVSLPR